jgi:hypothetical protein
MAYDFELEKRIDDASAAWIGYEKKICSAAFVISNAAIWFRCMEGRFNRALRSGKIRYVHEKTRPRISIPLAISTINLSNRSFDWSSRIVYFGMTNAISGLKGRLKQFDHTINGKTGHGGAERLLSDFRSTSDLSSVLYVAVMPFECRVASNQPSDLRTMGSVSKAEYDCFAHFVERFGRLPKYNDKKNSPKFKKSVNP